MGFFLLECYFMLAVVIVGVKLRFEYGLVAFGLPRCARKDNDIE